MNEHEARVESLLEEIRDLLAEANTQRDPLTQVLTTITNGGLENLITDFQQGTQEAVQAITGTSPIVMGAPNGVVPVDEDDEPTYHHECGGNVEVNLIGDDVYDIVMTCAGCGQRSHGIATINGGDR